jgi:hypothetical protein
MKRITALAAVLIAGAIGASPALGDDHARDTHARNAGAHTGAPIEDAFPYRETPDRIDRSRDPAGTSERYEQVVPAPKIQPGQPAWPVNPQPLPRPASAVPADDGGTDDSVWLLVGAGFAAAGIVGGSAAGIARRQRLRARRVAA